jgi:hypothetical protein
MSQVKLEPGWLARDVSQATERTNAWNLQKSKSVVGEPSNKSASQKGHSESGQSQKD